MTRPYCPQGIKARLAVIDDQPFEVLYRNHQKGRIRKDAGNNMARRRAELTSPTAPNGVRRAPDPLGSPAGYGLRGKCPHYRPVRVAGAGRLCRERRPAEVLGRGNRTPVVEPPMPSQRSGALARSHSTGNGPCRVRHRLPHSARGVESLGRGHEQVQAELARKKCGGQLALHTIAGRIEPRRECTQPALAG